MIIEFLFWICELFFKLFDLLLTSVAIQTIGNFCQIGFGKLCQKNAIFISGKAAFDRWFQHYNKEKPKMPTLQGSQHLTKQVTLEKQTMQYNINLEQWKATQEALAQEAHDKLMAVLTFSEG